MNSIKITKTDESANLTKDKIGYILCSNRHFTINPQHSEKLNTCIKLKMPNNIYYRAESLIEELLINNVYNTDYIIITLYNISYKPYEIKIGDNIARIMFFKYCELDVEEIKIDNLIEKLSMWELHL